MQFLTELSMSYWFHRGLVNNDKNVLFRFEIEIF